MILPFNFLVQLTFKLTFHKVFQAFCQENFDSEFWGKLVKGSDVLLCFGWEHSGACWVPQRNLARMLKTASNVLPILSFCQNMNGLVIYFAMYRTKDVLCGLYLSETCECAILIITHFSSEASQKWSHTHDIITLKSQWEG